MDNRPEILVFMWDSYGITMKDHRMHDFADGHSTPPEQVIRLDDKKAGLDGLIVIHSTRLGPSAGGCRIWHYPDAPEAARDAMRLAEGMTYKNALAGLPLGGGKTVIRRPAGDFDRAALLEAFGKAIDRLEGRYVTAEDVGTTVADMAIVRRATRHVAGLAPREGRVGGDPSPYTARGVFGAMRVAVERRLGRELSGVTVAVQGLGNVGYALCRMLHEAGARLIVADTRSDVVARAMMEFDAEGAGTQVIHQASADVFAPCALGSVLNETTIPKLKAKLVCGAANNQLARPEHGEMLAARDVLYAPDYVVNSGGIINVAAEYLDWPKAMVEQKIDAIKGRLMAVCDHAEDRGSSTNDAADALARDIIAAGPVRTPDAVAA